MLNKFGKEMNSSERDIIFFGVSSRTYGLTSGICYKYTNICISNAAYAVSFTWLHLLYKTLQFTAK